MSARPKHPLLTPKWIAGHLLALTLVVAFLNFGFWQLRRLEQARSRNAVIEQQEALPPATLSEALTAALNGAPLDHRRAEVTGEYAPQAEVLLRGRMLNGQPGFHVLTPLVLGESEGELAGTALLVERGWVPYALDTVPVADALPPAGSVRVAGELRSPQSPPTGALSALAARDPPEGALKQAFYVDVERLRAQMPFELAPAYLQLREQLPPAAGELPQALPPEVRDTGPHLGYAIQWFSFALIGIIGYAFLLRSVLRQPPPTTAS